MIERAPPAVRDRLVQLQSVARTVTTEIRYLLVDLLSTVEILGWELFGLAFGVAGLLGGLVAWIVVVLALMLVGWIYDFVLGGIVHALFGISISLGSTGDTIGNMLILLVLLLVPVVAGLLATVTLFENDKRSAGLGELVFGNKRFTYPFAVLLLPGVFVWWFSRDGLSALLIGEPLFGVLLATWILYRAGIYTLASHRESVLGRFVPNRGLTITTMVIGISWANTAALFELFRQLWQNGYQTLTEQLSSVPFIELTPRYAALIPLLLGTGLILNQLISNLVYTGGVLYPTCRDLARRLYTLFQYVVLLRPINS